MAYQIDSQKIPYHLREESIPTTVKSLEISGGEVNRGIPEGEDLPFLWRAFFKDKEVISPTSLFLDPEHHTYLESVEKI